MNRRANLATAFRNPGLAATYLARRIRSFLASDGLRLQAYDNGCLSDMFGYTTLEFPDYEPYIDEIRTNKRLHEAQRLLVAKTASDWEPPARSVALYILTRWLEPDFCVETGVEHGVSTVYILEALHRNENGSLYSIDVPSPRLPDGESAGWIIPERSRDRWNLTVGRSEDYLGTLLQDIGHVDLFYHDSYHKYPLMSWEFDKALEYMDEGIVASDDIDRNHAFLELCTRTESTVNIVSPFKIGEKGTFGFAFVGDRMQERGIHTA